MKQSVFRVEATAAVLSALFVVFATPVEARAAHKSLVPTKAPVVHKSSATAPNAKPVPSAPHNALVAKPQSTTPMLGLAEAAAIARANSLAVRTSQEHLLGANLQRQLTLDGSWPSLGFQTDASYNQLPSDSPLLAFLSAPGGGGLVGFPAPGVTVDTSIRASQTLFDGFRIRDGLTVADDQISLGRLGVAQAEEDAMANAAIAYFGVLRAQGLAEVAATSVHQAEEHLRLGNERLKAGSGTRADVLTLRAQLATSQGNLIQASNAVSLARLQLDKTLNAPVGQRPLSTTAGVGELAIDLDQELAQGLPRRPEVQQQLLKAHLDDARASLASRGYWPTLLGQVNYIQRGLYQGNFSTGVVLNWNAFDGFKTRDQIALAQAEVAADAVALEQTRQDLALDVRTQAQARQEARDRIAIAREGLSAADEAYRISIQRYELGFSTSTELLDARTTLAQSRNTYIQATHDLNVAQIRLAKALGVDMAVYLAAGR